MKYSNKCVFLVCLMLLLFGVSKTFAQNDKLGTKNGDLTIIPINHATLVLKWQNEVIYFDPSGSTNLFKGVPKPTLILITDIHGDHLNINTLENMKFQDVKIIGPQAVLDQLPAGFSNVTSLGNSNDLDINEVNIKAIPMYNLPETSDSRHPKGRGNGYILTIGGKRIYISGDTEDIEEMRSLKKIDVAFVCMNLPYTMDVDAAASAVLDFKPKIVYPFHYRGKGGFSDVDKFKNLVESGNKSIEVRLRNWYSK
jgi:L-ascorbate metabolism protein UlaG (beta-lactamase superfamily)